MVPWELVLPHLYDFQIPFRSIHYFSYYLSDLKTLVYSDLNHMLFTQSTCSNAMRSGSNRKIQLNETMRNPESGGGGGGG